MTETLIFLLGLAIGSFLNVVIYRLPAGKSIIFPGSFCPECETRLKAWDLIPVLSFVFNQGQCRYCGTKISYQYPIIELGTATVLLLVYSYYGLSFLFLLYGVLALLLITTAGIDFNHLIIPNKLSYPGLLFGLAASLIGEHLTWGAALSGALIAGGSLLLVAVVSGGGLGIGDVKLAAVMGSFLGLWPTLVAIFIGSLLGSVVALYLIVVKDKGWKSKVPFGVFMALGGLIVILWGEAIIETYWQLFF